LTKSYRVNQVTRLTRWSTRLHRVFPLFFFQPGPVPVSGRPSLESTCWTELDFKTIIRREGKNKKKKKKRAWSESCCISQQPQKKKKKKKKKKKIEGWIGRRTILNNNKRKGAKQRTIKIKDKLSGQGKREKGRRWSWKQRWTERGGKRTNHRRATLALSLTYARQVDFFFLTR